MLYIYKTANRGSKGSTLSQRQCLSHMDCRRVRDIRSFWWKRRRKISKILNLQIPKRKRLSRGQRTVTYYEEKTMHSDTRSETLWVFALQAFKCRLCKMETKLALTENCWNTLPSFKGKRYLDDWHFKAFSILLSNHKLRSLVIRCLTEWGYFSLPCRFLPPLCDSLTFNKS